MAGKKRKKAVKGKKVTDTRDEDVIQLNIILDLDPGDDFKSAVKRAKSSAQQGPSDLRTYISRGKTISLTPLRIEVPSVESLLQRYGKHLAAPGGSNSGSPLAASSPKPRDVTPPPVTQPITCNKKKRVRPNRSKKKKRTPEIPSLKAEVDHPSETYKKQFHNEDVICTRESNKCDNDRDRNSKIGEDCDINHPPPTKSKGLVETSRKRLPKKHGNSSLPETIEDNPSTVGGSKVANSDTRLSLPSRIQLKKDWMNKLFSRSADRKTSKNDTIIQQVVDNKISFGLTGADKDSDAMPKKKNEANSPDMDKLEPNNTEVEVKVEKEVVNNVIMAVEEGNADAADVPVITEEIGIVTETRLEKILVKQESQDRVDPKQRTYEQIRPADKEINFIQFNEDSYDEEGPTEDPLMLIEDSDVSVIEDDDVIEVPASMGLSSTAQVENSKVTIVQDFIQATQRSISAPVSTSSDEATTEIPCVNQDSAVQLPDDSELIMNTQRSMLSIGKAVCRHNWIDKHASKINSADHNSVAQLPDESDDAVLTFDDRDNYADDTYKAMDEEAMDESDPGDVNLPEHTKAYSCPYCDEIYESSADLEQHGQMQHAKHQHTPKKPYACPLCRKRFSNIRWITAHISRMHKAAKGVVNRESTQLETESLEIAGNAVSSIDCPFASCPQTFDSQKALKNHILQFQFHGKNAKFRVPNLYQCKKCPMSFNRQSNLRAHVRFSHNTERKKNKRSTNEDDTSSSSSTAEDHDRFSCPPNDSYSGTFSSALGLQGHHSMSHSNSGGFNPRRKYFCSQCPNSYSHSSSLSAHNRYYHRNGKSAKERPHSHPCKICGISFKWPANLNSHMRFMHEERSSTQPSQSSNKFTFTCSECVGVGASFESISLLSKHKLQMHRPVPKQIACLNPDFVPPTPHFYNPDGEEAAQTSLATHEAALCNEFPTVTLSEDESDDGKQLFQSNEELQENRLAHTNSSANASKAIKEQSYPCSMCHMSFLWPKSLTIHESLVHKIRKQGKKRKKQNQRKKRNQLKKYPQPKQTPATLNYICVQCDNLSFSSSEDLQRHNQVVHKEAFAVALICQSGNGHAGSSNTNQAQPEAESESVFPYMNCEDNPAFRSTDFPPYTEQIVIVRHRCPDCFEEFPTLTEFENHATTHSQNYFQCPECPLQFNRASYLLEHQEASHTPLVPAVLPATTYLQGNVSSSNIQTQKPKPGKPQEPLKCSFCTRTFKKKHNLEVHEKLHVRELLITTSTSDPDTVQGYGGGWNEPANCPVCRSLISQKRNIPRHVESMHKLIMSTKDFTCTVCNKVVQFSPAGAQNYMCCQYERLRADMDLLNPETSTEQESYPVTCTLCEVGFDDMDQLKIHNSTCTETYRNACKVCGKIFKLRINLCRHEKLAHKATKVGKKYLSNKNVQPQPGKKAVKAPIVELAVLKFRCAICRVKFSREAEIEIHIQEAHSMEELPVKPFQCGSCPKIFPTIKGVRHHFASAHKDGLPARNKNSRYPCPCCTLTFSTTSKRHNHINSSHKGETPYKCSHPNCDERFETSEALHVHVDSSHAEADTIECTESRNNYPEEDGTPRGPFNPSEGIYGDSDPSLNQYWLQPPHNSSMYQAEQDLSDLLTNMETVEIGGGMMMKGEVELPDYTEPGDLPDFEFQEVLQETGDEQDDADFTFNIISHPPLEENSSENN